MSSKFTVNVWTTSGPIGIFSLAEDSLNALVEWWGGKGSWPLWSIPTEQGVEIVFHRDHVTRIDTKEEQQ